MTPIYSLKERRPSADGAPSISTAFPVYEVNADAIRRSGGELLAGCGGRSVAELSGQGSRNASNSAGRFDPPVATTRNCLPPTA